MVQLLLVLSPAKTLDFSLQKLKSTKPLFQEKANELVLELRKLSKSKLKSVFKVSDALAALNHERFAKFEFHDTTNRDKPAVFAFQGPAYQGLQPTDLTDHLDFAQEHLRILCGLYGILRPLDRIQPYRLEMGQKNVLPEQTLYEFWQPDITKTLNETFPSTESVVLLNVASNEYFKAIQVEALQSNIELINCVFKDDGKVKSVYAKRARGLFCRYVIQNRLNSIAQLKKFDLEGYRYSTDESEEKKTLVFVRSNLKRKNNETTTRKSSQAKKK